MQKYLNGARTLRGDSINNAQITVRDLAGALATIYSDNGTTPQANPIITGRDGEYMFYAANGRYSISVTAAGFVSESVSDVLLYDPSEAYAPIDGTISDTAASAFASKLAAADSATTASTQAGIAATKAGEALASKDAAGQSAIDANAIAVDLQTNWGDKLATATSKAAESTASATASEASRQASGVNADLAAAAKVQAETARDEASLYADPDFAVNSLLKAEPNGLIINATSDVVAKAVKQVAGGVTTYFGSIGDYIPAGFGGPKMITNKDGTVGWAPHNILGSSEDFNVRWALTGFTAVKGYADSDAGLTASLLTVTGTPLARMDQPSLYNAKLRRHSQEYIVRAGTASWCYVGFSISSVWAYFDLSTGGVGTVGAGLTANIYTTRADGTALPPGFYRIKISASSTGLMKAVFGICDANAATTVTAGKTLYLEKACLYFGATSTAYQKNTGVSIKTSAPYDWSRGGRRVLIEAIPGAHNSLWSDDLTQAVWIKANCTPALDATGPHLEACSSLVAAAADATCLQTIASATATQTFSAYVRRKTGTGAVSITADGGVSWTPVTLGAAFVRVKLHGGANPVIGFKLATSGDAIEVALAINSSLAYITSPVPTYDTIVNNVADSISLALPPSPAGVGYTVYIDMDRLDDSTFLDNAHFSIRNAANTSRAAWLSVNTIALGDFAFGTLIGGVTTNHNIYQPTAGERLEITGRTKDGAYACSVNGEPTAFLPTPGLTSSDFAYIGGGGQPLYLRRFVFVPREISGDEVRLWRYSGGMRNNLIAAEVVARHGAVSDAKMNREPTLLILADDGAQADIAVWWMNKHDVGHHQEAPARLMQRNYRYTKETNTLVAMTAPAVIQQQPGWFNGLGHLQSPSVFRVPSGINAGRLVMLFSALDSTSGTFSGDDRNIYRMFNDRAGAVDGWSSPVKVVDATDFGTGAMIADCAGSGLVLPAGHPVAPNRFVTYLYTVAGFVPMYSDDFGATWLQGPLFAGPSGIEINESNTALLPDGSIVATHRVGTVPRENRRVWSKSVDGGVTYVDQGLIPNFIGSQCSAGLAQLDSSGVVSPFGKLVLTRPEVFSTFERCGTRIDFATDATMEFKNPIWPWAKNRYMGYSAVKPIFGGSLLVVGVEGGSNRISFNGDNTTHLSIVEVPK